jgi:hypothetical protein
LEIYRMILSAHSSITFPPTPAHRFGD